MNLPRIGLGCMELSHAYGVPPSFEDGLRMLRASLDAGVTFLDTATLYGAGRNEELVGAAIAGRRDEIVLASKGGMAPVDGVKTIDGRPETLSAQVDASLQRLGVDHIDLYYLHRWDPNVPIGDSVGALADAVAAGKIGGIGLSEISVALLHEALAVAPIAAVQNEYSLWTRNAEIGMLEATREAGAAFVAFSPVARGFLADAVADPDAFAPKDIRRSHPRFMADNWPANAALLPAWRALVAEAGCTPAQLALAWVLSRGEHVVAIPGTTRIEHLREDLAAAEIVVDPTILARAGELISTATVSGPRYNEAQSLEVFAETFEEVA
ncbi:aldo/keto reductase [Microbacterium thalassium]|uniref:Aryl-alcohol dehydrogenase-like predicted oxidoreductase n=1 Tax=Microbacterium thalassium TaxID=362649 RepID=A0A7X0KTQ2_9MICO|nr:aldo/keto reductase [Microbacterium thalassium]MBB6390361.1 aryl-alcohol dehydrogenase-like predicted oxidoreductase [Microbacterium thalassium]GLK25470.1 aldo/keto reductase [Microbacterium thalassium]